MTVAKEIGRSPETISEGIRSTVYTPDYIVTNTQLAQFLNEQGVRTKSERKITEEEIVRRTGIESRHLLQPLGDSPHIRSEVVPEMANRVIEEVALKTQWSQVDCLFTLHSLPYKKSLIRSVADHLETNCNISVVRTFPDVYAECASPIWTLHYIRLMQNEFLGKSIVIVSSEYLSPIADGLNQTLLSDGAAAFAFCYGQDLEVLGSAAKHFPEFKSLIRAPIKPEYLPPEGYLFFFEVGEPSEKRDNSESQIGGLPMEYGEIEPQVLSWALDQQTFPPLIKETFEGAGIEPNEITLVVPHQANKRITEGLRKLLPPLGIQAEVYSNIENHGNTGAVSILLAWHEATLEGKINKGDNVLLLGFGAGMTAAAAVVKVLK